MQVSAQETTGIVVTRKGNLHKDQNKETDPVTRKDPPVIRELLYQSIVSNHRMIVVPPHTDRPIVMIIDRRYMVTDPVPITTGIITVATIVQRIPVRL